MVKIQRMLFSLYLDFCFVKVHFWTVTKTQEHKTLHRTALLKRGPQRFLHHGPRGFKLE